MRKWLTASKLVGVIANNITTILEVEVEAVEAATNPANSTSMLSILYDSEG